ncbi:MAG TPA: hypothetical protein VK171_14785, partial [Fimbriimonas sp.]|nr:hypothetical protein [Fimbriimonas sp.]
EKMENKIQLVQTKVAEAGGITDAKYDGGTTIGPTLQREVQLGAVNGVLVSILLIVSYLAVRFGSITAGPIMALIGVPSVIYVAHEWLLEKNPMMFYGIALVGIVALLGYLVYEGGKASWGLRFSLSAIGALFHDILVVVFMAAFFGYVFSWDVSSLFLTAMLTIIGFSVHDTIVIFDRIRENLRHQESGENLEHLVNKSVTQSFSRSLNTSGTVILTLLLLVFFGTVTPDLKFFVVTMLLGILSGTYSSIYNASPILYLWDRAVTKKHGEDVGLIALSKADAAQTARYRAQAQQHSPNVSRPTSTGGTTSGATGEGGTPGRTYGQVRRRAKDTVKDSWRELD